MKWVTLAEIWCKAMHESLMWPSHGHYECRTCGREYPVPWERDVTKRLWRQEMRNWLTAECVSVEDRSRTPHR
jgi:hypothetical protein